MGLALPYFRFSPHGFLHVKYMFSTNRIRQSAQWPCSGVLKDATRQISDRCHAPHCPPPSPRHICVQPLAPLPCLLRFASLRFAAGHVSRQHAHGLAVGQKRLGQKRHLRGAGPHRLADYLGSYDSTAVSTSALCASPIRLQHGVLGTKRGTKGTDRGCPGSWSHTCDGMPHV